MESLFVMAQVAPTEYPKDNLEKADSLVKEAAEKYLVFVGMDEKELETYRKKQQKTDRSDES